MIKNMKENSSSGKIIYDYLRLNLLRSILNISLPVGSETYKDREDQTDDNLLNHHNYYRPLNQNLQTTYGESKYTIYR